MSRTFVIVLAILTMSSVALAQVGNQSDRSEIQKRFYNAGYRAREAPNLIRAESLVITELSGAVVTVSGADKDVLVITSPNVNQRTASRFFSGFSSHTSGPRYFRVGFTTVRISNGQQSWDATPTEAGFSTAMGRLSEADVKPEDCCSTLQQEKEYCKAWAAGVGNAKIWYSHTWEGSPGYCPTFLIKLHDEAALYGKNDTQGITEDEKQKAEEAIAEDARKTAAKNFLDAHRCSDQDPRPMSEREADPICVARRRQAEAEAKVQREQQQTAASAHAAMEKRWKKLGLHQGLSQQAVKTILAANGFHAPQPNGGPWACDGGWNDNGQYTVMCVALDSNVSWYSDFDSREEPVRLRLGFILKRRYRSQDTGEVYVQPVAQQLFAADYGCNDEGSCSFSFGTK